MGFKGCCLPWTVLAVSHKRLKRMQGENITKEADVLLDPRADDGAESGK